jgi:hypothetical protein
VKTVARSLVIAISLAFAVTAVVLFLHGNIVGVAPAVFALYGLHLAASSSFGGPGAAQVLANALRSFGGRSSPS